MKNIQQNHSDRPLVLSLFGLLTVVMMLVSGAAQALPTFARQTGQSCVACHAGGQYPELTPYGRLFKLTGYTLGERPTVPLSVMGVASYTKTINADPSSDFPKNAVALFQTGSVFLAGKITDNIGMFAQATYDNYANQDPTTNQWSGHSHSDNIDLRYADRFISSNNDLIVGLSLNNNPSVTDVWNTAPAWIQYVPTNFGVTGANAAPMVSQLGQQVAGLGAYVFWNKTLYTEVALYQTAKGALTILKSGNDIGNRLSGSNPYWRLALSHEWGPHNVMAGMFGMNADVFPDPTVPSGPTTHYRDRGVDMQYQYLLDEHAFTTQLSYIHESIRGGDVTGVASNATNTLNQLQLKASYVYRATYGGSLSYHQTTGSSDATLYAGLQDDGTGTGNMIPIPGSGSMNNNPDTRIVIPELFWMPMQYARVGLQYYKYNRFNGASSNFDGAGRNAKDNNTLFVYVWAAY